MKRPFPKPLSGAFLLLLILLTASVAVDTARNRVWTPLPSRPEEPLIFDTDGLLYAFHHDLYVSPEEQDLNINQACTYVDGRYDCADFRLVSLMRILYRHPEKLTEEQKDRIQKTVLGFKYWMDQDGYDSMCYWSENHQILFSSAEYLAGQLYPDLIFTSTGLTGTEHRDMARERILIWLEQRWTYGFTEFYSNVYYVEDIAPLSNLIDFSEDTEIVTKATIIMDLLLYDLASQSFKGTFVTSSGRAYENKRKTGLDSSMRAVSQELFSYPVNPDDRIGMEQNFLVVENYELPGVLALIGRDEEERIIKASNGLNLSELKEEGLIGLEDRQIMMQWAMESFSNPETINNTLDYINRNKMYGQEAFQDFRLINYTLLRSLGLLPLISRTLGLQTNGTAIQRGNVYTYKTPQYSMSTSQAYHPGTHGDQQALWQATLSNELSLVITHPAVLPHEKGPTGNSPTYWVGDGRLPHAVQDRNIAISLYRLPRRAGIMEKRMLPFTHAWFPEALFDEAVVEGNHAFGRLDETYVAMTANSALEYIDPPELTVDGAKRDPPGRRELIQRGRETYWITEFSTAEEEDSFEAFRERIRSNETAYSGKTLTYSSRGRTLELTWKGDFKVNGEVQNTEYMRFDSPYIRAERKAETLDFEFGGQKLHLDFHRGIREF